MLPLLGIITSIGSTVGGFFKGLFSFKAEQAETVQSALKILKSVNDVDGQQTTAAAQALSSILTNGSWLEKQWRPVMMILCMVLIGCAFFGYVPPGIDAPLSPTMERVWTMLQIGLGGYLPLRTLEKIVTQFNVSGILKALINKKVV